MSLTNYFTWNVHRLRSPAKVDESSSLMDVSCNKGRLITVLKGPSVMLDTCHFELFRRKSLPKKLSAVESFQISGRGTRLWSSTSGPTSSASCPTLSWTSSTSRWDGLKSVAGVFSTDWFIFCLFSTTYITLLCSDHCFVQFCNCFFFLTYYSCPFSFCLSYFTILLNFLGHSDLVGSRSDRVHSSCHT